MLIPRLVWPLLIYDASTSTVKALERKISTGDEQLAKSTPESV